MYYKYADEGSIVSVDDEYVDGIDVVINARQKFIDENPSTWKSLWEQMGCDNSLEALKAKEFIYH